MVWQYGKIFGTQTKNRVDNSQKYQQNKRWKTCVSHVKTIQKKEKDETSRKVTNFKYNLNSLNDPSTVFLYTQGYPNSVL